MLSPARLLVFVIAVGACLQLSAVQAQEDNEPRQSLPQRFEQFGRSLVGGNRANNRPAPKPTRNAAPQRDDSDYNAPFVEEEGTSRNRGATEVQPATRRNAPQREPQQASRRRVVDDTATAHAPPLGEGMRRAPTQTNTGAKPTPASDGVMRTARATNPGRDEDVAAPPAAVPAVNDSAVMRSTSPSISIETLGPRKISVGKQATFKLILNNTGAMSARDVVVTIAVPDFAEVVDAKPTNGTTEPAPTQDGICWKLSTLTAQGHEELSLDIVPRKSQPFDLAVRWTQAPVASQTTVEVQEPKLALSLDGAKEVAFGERSTYKLQLSNPGTGDAESVVITLAPLDPSDGPPASHPLGTLRAGESKTIEIELIARQAGQVAIHAEAKAAGDITATLEEEVTVRRAALTVATKGPKMQYAGTAAAYEFHVTNTGNAAAQNVRVTCRMPRGAEFVSCSSSGNHADGADNVQWTVATLAPNAEVTLSLKCLLRSAGANEVEINCVGDRELQQSATMSTQVQAVADLAMDVVDPSGPVAVGTEAVYEIHVRNRGTKTAEAIDVTAYFSNGIEPVSVDGGQHEIKPGMVSLRTIGAIDPGKEVVFKIRAKAESPGTHRFRAEMNCASLDTKLTQEEATLFYAEAAEAAQ